MTTDSSTAASSAPDHAKNAQRDSHKKARKPKQPRPVAKERSKNKYVYSAPSFRADLAVKTEQAKNLSGKIFDTLSSSVFIIDVVARRFQDRSTSLNYEAVSGAISKMIDDMAESIKTDRKQLEHFLQKSGVDLAKRPSYRSPVSRSYEVSSPEVSRIADLITSYDELLQLVDTAWLKGLLSSDDAVEFRTTKSREMGRMIRNLISSAMAARDKVFKDRDDASVEVREKIMAEEARNAAETIEREKAGFIESPDAVVA